MHPLGVFSIFALIIMAFVPNASVAGDSHVHSASCNKIALSHLGNVASVWRSPGTSMPPAEMRFFATGIMELRSNYFSKNESVNYFLWEKPDDSELIVLRSCSKLPKAFYNFQGSRLGSEAIQVDQDGASITYKSHQGKLLFNNTYFYEMLP